LVLFVIFRKIYNVRYKYCSLKTVNFEGKYLEYNPDYPQNKKKFVELVNNLIDIISNIYYDNDYNSETTLTLTDDISQQEIRESVDDFLYDYDDDFEEVE